MANLKPLMGSVVEQLSARLVELGPAIEEHARIQDALGAVGESTSSAAERSRPAARRKPGPRRGSRRAPRGANRAKILAAASREARTVAEITEITGIKKTVVATSVSTLAKRGLLRRDSSGGYRTVSDLSAARSGGRRLPRAAG